MHLKGIRVAMDEASGARTPSLHKWGLRKYAQLDLWLDRILDRPHWKLRALILVLGLSLCRAFPSYDALSTPFAQAT